MKRAGLVRSRRLMWLRSRSRQPLKQNDFRRMGGKRDLNLTKMFLPLNQGPLFRRSERGADGTSSERFDKHVQAADIGRRDQFPVERDSNSIGSS